jgi:metal-responsive CopG/Arc/MetJ family transcriptional regulator
MKIENLYLSDKQIAELEMLSAEKDLSVSELIRRAIDAYLDDERRKRKESK